MDGNFDFLRQYRAQRLDAYDPQPPLYDEPTDGEPAPPGVLRDYELGVDEASWDPRKVVVKDSWRPEDWSERPVRFIDGKDVGRTVAWLQAPGGYPIPIRLSEIGGVDIRVEDGICRRDYAVVERVVSMVVDPFPWTEIEAFAVALQRHGFRLLPATPPDNRLSYDFEKMRKAAENRSNTEMAVLEEAVLSREHLIPTVVDGRLEPRSGGFRHDRSPVVGVIKTHRRNYLHARGLQVLYQLDVGERTPLFLLREARPQVVSWYVRLSGEHGLMPNTGIVRIEVARAWFEDRSWPERLAYVGHLSHLLHAYRCRDAAYARAAVSLHPIVRGERLLGALFTPTERLTNRFYHLTNL